MPKFFSIHRLVFFFLFTPVLIPLACNQADSPTTAPSHPAPATSTPTATFTPCGSPVTFGKTTTGSADSTLYNCIFGDAFTLASTGTLYKLSANFATGAGVQAAMGVYTGTLSSPANLLVQSTAKTCVAGWNDFPVSPTALSAGTYWVCTFVGPYPGTAGSVIESSGTASDHYGFLELSGFGGGTGTFPAVATGWTTSIATSLWDMYATYCP